MCTITPPLVKLFWGDPNVFMRFLAIENDLQVVGPPEHNKFGSLEHLEVLAGGRPLQKIMPKGWD